MRKILSNSTLLIYALVVLTSPRPLFGDDASKRAKLGELMTLQGREEIAEQQLQVYKKQTLELASKALEQYRTALNLADNDPYYTRMVAASQRFYEASLPPFTAAEATNFYADLMAEHLSEADVDALLAFYKSSAGQRAIEAARKVGPQWQENIGKKAQESAMGQYKEFQAEMVKIAAECEAEQNAGNKQAERRGGKH